MACIPYFKPADTDTEKLKLLGIEPYKLNIFKIAAHATTPIVCKFICLPSAVLTSGKLDLILREIAIVRIGILCHSEYEVYQQQDFKTGGYAGGKDRSACHRLDHAGFFRDRTPSTAL